MPASDVTASVDRLRLKFLSPDIFQPRIAPSVNCFAMLVPTLLIPIKLHARQRFALANRIAAAFVSFQFRDFLIPILGRPAGRAD